MQSFDSDGVRIAYVDEGKGDAILLIHGFASNVATNWRDVHWLRTLTAAGRRNGPLALSVGGSKSRTVRTARTVSFSPAI